MLSRDFPVDKECHYLELNAPVLNFMSLISLLLVICDLVSKWINYWLLLETSVPKHFLPRKFPSKTIFYRVCAQPKEEG